MSVKILVVEDDPSVRGLLQTLLSAEGYDVATASDGLAGLVKATSAPPSLVLLDLMMPEMDGFEVLRTLQGTPDLADLPVIVITSKDLSRDEIEWLRARTTDLVHKGQSGRAELVAALKRHLGERATA